jgi:hypothetical protein
LATQIYFCLFERRHELKLEQCSDLSFDAAITSAYTFLENFRQTRPEKGGNSAGKHVEKYFAYPVVSVLDHFPQSPLELISATRLASGGIRTSP